MDYLYRQYQEGDKDAVWKLHIAGLNQTNSYSHIKSEVLGWDKDLKDIHNVYLNNSGDFLVVEDKNNHEVIGMGALRKVDDETGEIKRMRVAEDYQRKGIGKTILEKLSQKAKEIGYKHLILDTSINQVPAQKLYEKFGFQEYKRGELGGQKMIFYRLDL